ncbi:putative NHP6B-nonhistone chromosomal protein [Sporodiniella umbellata]|nr:putative NHP6B-nonhistone chromosomal protein [Sporodiniella umbellata]
MVKETTKVTKAISEDDKKARGKKAASGPKRGLSAYMFFSKDQRATVKEQNPDATFGKIGKLLGEKWKSMSDADKKTYNDMAAADKQRYETEKAAVVSA